MRFGQASPGCSRLTGGMATGQFLVDADLSGLLVGMTLATTAPEIYRALIEATAFGTRMIIDAFEKVGSGSTGSWPAAGCLNATGMLMQIYADITVEHSASRLRPDAGPGIGHVRAVAAGPEAGGYATIEDAAGRMAHLRDEAYDRSQPITTPTTSSMPSTFAFTTCSGRGGDPAIKTLKRLRLRAVEAVAAS